MIMKRYRWLILVLVPLADIFLLVRIAEMVGLLPTASMVIITASIGLLLVRSEGTHTIQKLIGGFQKGELPTDHIIDGICIMIAGVCLLTPGLITDLVGLILVLPPTRYPIRLFVKKWGERTIRSKYSFGDNVYIIRDEGDRHQ
tara:strand:- start:286 stop:717 length:432 start_codon:yes stop_codon:yes gene_type:complete